MKGGEFCLGTNIALKLGGKVQVRVGSNWFSTIVEFVADDLTFYVSPLLSLRQKVSLAKGKTYSIHVLHDRGIFEFDTLVLETDYKALNENLPLTKLLIVTEPRLLQRRDAFRVAIMVNIHIRETAEDGKTAEEVPIYRTKALNLSENGMMFLTKKNYEPGTVLNCDILLDKFGMDETLRGIAAEVVRIGPAVMDDTLYQIGVVFREMPRQDRRLLVKFIMTSQREIRKKTSE
jgi:c-di-GMP-binding flagellar brake protein YcgR